LRWTLDGTLDPTRRKGVLIFACRSACCWVFAKMNTWSSTLAIWYERDNDYNCLVGNPVGKSLTESEIELFKVQWRTPCDINKLSMLRALKSGRYLSMNFRSWDLYEYPLLDRTTKHSWVIKTATQLEKPWCYLCSTDRSKEYRVTLAYDNCNLSNVKLYLNSAFHPYDDLNLDFGKKRYIVLFDMYARFRRSYYRIETLLNVLSFIEKGSFLAIDCSR